MELFSPDVLPWFLYFFVPGFISIKVYGLLVPAAERDWRSSVFEAVAYSCINYALTSGLLAIATQSNLAVAYPFLRYCVLFVVLFGAPALWPYMMVKLLSARWLGGKIGYLIPKAWDHFFRNRRKACWVLVHLKGGGLVGGVFSENSFASSYPDPEDLYLEEVWQVSDDGAFERAIPGTRGLWVSREAFDVLEFFGVD